MSKEQTTRPRVRFGVTILAVVGLLLSMTFIPVSTAGAQTSQFTAGDATVQTNSGMLKQITVAPNGDVEYYGFEQEPDNVTIQVEAKPAGASSWEQVHSAELISDGSGLGLEGNISYDVSTIDLLAQTSMKKQDFRPTDGKTSETDVQVRVTVTFAGAGPNGDNVQTTSQDTFTVIVENIAAGGNVGGNANTNANGK